MDKSIISMWGAPQCLKEIKERKVLKQVANAKWMRVICFIGPIVAFFCSPPPNTTTSPGTQHNSANDVICGSAEVSPRRCRRTQLYHSGKQKRETHPFIQRSISKVPQILPAEQRPPLAAPPRSSHLSLSSSRRRSLVDWAPFQTHFSCPPMLLRGQSKHSKTAFLHNIQSHRSAAGITPLFTRSPPPQHSALQWSLIVIDHYFAPSLTGGVSHDDNF